MNMEQLTIFKICDLYHNQRQVIACLPTRESVCHCGSSVLQKQICRILLAADGCEITSDLVLGACQSQLLMLLSQGEVWLPLGANNVTLERTDNSSNQLQVPIGNDGLNENADEMDGLDGGPETTVVEMKTFFLGDLLMKNHHVEGVVEDHQEASTSAQQTISSVHTAEEVEPNQADENQSPNVLTKRPAEQSITIQVSKKKMTTDMKFDSYTINWTKVSDLLLAKFKQHQDYANQNPGKAVPQSVRVSNDDINSVIQAVIDQLRVIDKNISAEVMKTVAMQMTKRFPFLDYVDDDGVKDKGYVPLKYKLINRNSYYTRFKEGKVASSSRSEKSKQLHAKSGTLKEYWENISAECTTATRSILLRNEPDLLTETFLEESQPYVRHLLNSEDMPSTLLNWPILRRNNLLEFHFEKATGRNLNDLSKYLLAKKAKIIDYSRIAKKTIPLGKEATMIEIITFLGFLVGETLDKLIINKEMGTKLDDIYTDEASPVLVAIDFGADKYMYYVVAEKTRLTEGTHDILEALQQLMAVYYIYNFMYIAENSKLLELIQEYFLKIIPIRGSKSRATRVGGRQRVVKRVIQALSVHEVIE